MSESGGRELKVRRKGGDGLVLISNRVQCTGLMLIGFSRILGAMVTGRKGKASVGSLRMRTHVRQRAITLVMEIGALRTIEGRTRTIGV